MTSSDFRVEVEADLTWRKNELVFYKNILSRIDNDTDKERYRKSLVLMLYSHLEGFIKNCLLTYIKVLNHQQLERNKFNMNIVATSMKKEFNAFDSKDSKNIIFKSKLPDDTKLHGLSRRIDLLTNITKFSSEILEISDDAIDTESNLWYIVLQKNFFRIGLPLDLFEEYAKDIDSLVNRRNSIAHGSEKSGINENEYAKWENRILIIMEDTIRILFDYVDKKRFFI